ncbi:hypothetical protein AJ80_00880 [Polytolypa hystricis UAMH7299]|uniref:Uncharacterized protein n=1 Tax=Polytolypa hystricis (strain UAMH7299) TaxID=1447883 RepID=A0A2B7Z2W6_POLH7|nr:hypothetical protein AJ80_00880 [Polytolypa hystricis UAMH7299]
MFGFEDAESQGEKCYTTISKFQPFIDPEQPPTKKAPFSAILNHPFIHSAELILPEEIYSTSWDLIASKLEKSNYAKVIMPLSALLEHDFFNTYIKVGNILMLSEGHSGVDNVFSLKDGVLRLELDKSTYEQAGLVGKPVRSGGRKHIKTRYAVELNLRLPSMLHGRKAFDRIVWAFKNVLNRSVSWVFCDLAPTPATSGESAPIKQHHPQTITLSPLQTSLERILVPPISSTIPPPSAANSGQEFLRESCEELEEWLALVSLNSPRVKADDSIDPYLSRYDVPNRDECVSMDLVRVSWKGLVPSKWITQLLIATVRQCLSHASPQAWFALSCSALARDVVDGKNGYTILSIPPSEVQQEPAASESASSNDHRQQRQFICWEYVG